MPKHLADNDSDDYFDLFFSILLRTNVAFEPQGCCWIHPKGPGYVLKVFTGEPSQAPRWGEEWPFEHALPEAEFQRLVKKARSVTVSVAPPPRLGYDGHTWQLVLENGHNRAVFTWWVECPEGWRDLESFVSEVLEVVRRHAPDLPPPSPAEA